MARQRTGFSTAMLESGGTLAARVLGPASRSPAPRRARLSRSRRRSSNSRRGSPERGEEHRPTFALSWFPPPRNCRRNAESGLAVAEPAGRADDLVAAL